MIWPSGIRLVLKWPKSDTEKELLRKGSSSFKLVDIARHGYARVAEDNGAIWLLHPESLEATEYTADPGCGQRHHHHNGIYCGSCRGWA